MQAYLCMDICAFPACKKLFMNSGMPITFSFFSGNSWIRIAYAALFHLLVHNHYDKDQPYGHIFISSSILALCNAHKWYSRCKTMPCSKGGHCVAHVSFTSLKIEAAEGKKNKDWCKFREMNAWLVN